MIASNRSCALMICGVIFFVAGVGHTQDRARRFWISPQKSPPEAKPPTRGIDKTKKKKKWGNANKANANKWKNVAKGNAKKWNRPTGKNEPDQATTTAEIESLKKEIESLRATLEAAHLVPVETTSRGLTQTEQQEMDALKSKLEKLNSQRDSIKKAIEGGLDPVLVQQNLVEIESNIAETKAAIKSLNEVASEPVAQPPTVSRRAETMQSEIRALKTEIERLKTAREQAKKKAEAEAKIEAKKHEKTEKSLREKIGEALPIELFAFGDFILAYRESGDDGFEIGQLELDLNQQLGAYVTVSVAVAYNGDSESFGVGAYTIDSRLAGKSSGHLLQTNALETAGIVFGRFDVPFGIDYLEYPSIERRLVTRPIAVDLTHGVWKDLGGQLYFDAKVFNMVFYVVNGFGYDIEETIGEGEAEETVVNRQNVDIAVGSRLGAKPVDAFEIGGSVAGFLSEAGGTEIILAGGDLALCIREFSLKGEYIFHLIGASQDRIAWNHGVYGTAMYDFKPVFVVGRYSMMFPDDRAPEYGYGKDTLKQLSAGIGIQVLENAEVRLEYSSTLEKKGSAVFVQLAGGAAWQPTGLRR